jgi:hypothetical protein
MQQVLNACPQQAPFQNELNGMTTQGLMNVATIGPCTTFGQPLNPHTQPSGCDCSMSSSEYNGMGCGNYDNDC